MITPDHSKPHGNMSADQLVALFADSGRHPNALQYEIVRCKLPVLLTLAYGEHAETPMADVPAGLAEVAYNEMERRQGALSRLLADNPGLRAALAMEG